MNWNHHFAGRTAQMQRTAVRELLKLTARPGVISFAGGLPAPELFPLERVRQVTDAVLVRAGQAALQYGETEGLAELRDWIAGQFSTPELRVMRSNVVIVSGGQQALDLVGRVLLNPGDLVAVENPTYLALLSAWRPMGVEFLPVACDAQGLRSDLLRRITRTRRPKLVYTVPNFQNPQGTTLAGDRRLELIDWLQAAGVGLVEDNPYGDLRYSGDALPNLYTLDLSQRAKVEDGQVIYVGTFSKVLMPGLRIGYVVAPEPVIEKLVRAKQAADLHTSTLNQHITWELLRGGFVVEHVKLLCQKYLERRDAMLRALEGYLPEEATWTRPAGGMFLMVTLPRGVSGRALLNKALERQVAFVPGEDFHLNGEGQGTIRLNFTNAAPELIEEGIKRLGRVLKEMVTAQNQTRENQAVPHGIAGRQ
jgi:2-aminoadipate transaminase